MVIDTYAVIIEFFPLFVVMLTSAAIILSKEFIEGQEPSLQAFLRAVADGKNYVYEEIIRPIYVALAGVFIGVLAILMIIVTTPPYPPIIGPMTAVAVTAILVMFIGACWFLLLTRRTSFRGITRVWLSVALSYLDAKESGIADVGLFKAISRPPRQFALFRFVGPSASSILLRRMQSMVGWRSHPVVELEASKNQMVMLRPLVVLVPLVLVVILVSALIIPSMAFPLALLAILVCAYAFYTYLGARKRLEKARSEVATQTDTAPPETVTEVLRLLREEYTYPLRLLTVREHSELVYTGRVYTSTTDVRFREAVFIPSVPP